MKTSWLLIFVVILSLIFFMGSFQTWRVVHAPLILKDEPVVIELKPSMTLKALAGSLAQKKLINHPRIIIRYVQLMGLAKKFKAGVYEIKAGDTVKTLLDKIVNGQVLTKSFTIIEGSTLDKLNANLLKAPFLIHNIQDFSFLAGNAYPDAEGLVLADTYAYQAGSDAKSLVQRANANLLRVLKQSFEQKSPTLPYKSAYELLIVASILEKETASLAEKKLISGIIVNRLKKGMPLQMDPTVIYALKAKYQGKLHHADLFIDSPYNTYKNRGLPPTPIAIVGKESIEAAAHPQFSTYLYFVADGQGKHIFSTTYEAQKAAVEKYKNRDKHGQN